MKHLILVLLVQVVFTANVFAVGDAVAGKEKSQACVACHGENGMSPTPQFPNIAGQHEDYLYQALSDYKSGQRKNAIMGGIVAALSDQDMKDLAEYFSGLEGLHNLGLPE